MAPTTEAATAGASGGDIPALLIRELDFDVGRHTPALRRARALGRPQFAMATSSAASTMDLESYLTNYTGVTRPEAPGLHRLRVARAQGGGAPARGGRGEAHDEHGAVRRAARDRGRRAQARRRVGRRRGQEGGAQARAARERAEQPQDVAGEGVDPDGAQRPRRLPLGARRLRGGAQVLRAHARLLHDVEAHHHDVPQRHPRLGAHMRRFTPASPPLHPLALASHRLLTARSPPSRCTWATSPTSPTTSRRPSRPPTRRTPSCSRGSSRWRRGSPTSRARSTSRRRASSSRRRPSSAPRSPT